MRRAVYPGSFDPLTNGHVNIIERGLEMVDELIVAVARNASKNALFTIDERVEMVREAFPDRQGLIVQSFEGLLVDFAAEKNCNCILRGLRAVADFEYEYQMANMNRHINDSVDTIFLMADPNNFYVSSRLVKEVASLGGEVPDVIPANVRSRLTNRYEQKKK